VIAEVTGDLIAAEPEGLVMVRTASGLTYEIAVSEQTLRALDPAGREARPVCILTKLIVRETNLSLVGFSSIAERSVYELLTLVKGVGSKQALLLLALDWRELTQAIDTGNVEKLKAIKGVGARTAERLVLELRGKLVGFRV
jgi:Holliday junction DNA helicase RuvA